MSYANTLATQKSSEERFTGFLFWVVLPDGRHNSLSCNSLSTTHPSAPGR